MGALAGLLCEAGFQVTGAEAKPVYPPMSELLKALNISVFYGYKPENLAQAQPDLVIVGNVIRRTNPEVQEVLNLKIPYFSFPEALRHFFLTGKKSLVVAGTHGKTTTSALLSHCLERLHTNPTFLVGGLLQSKNKNFTLGQGPYVVLEGDEYDTAFFDKRPKFVHYAPEAVILTGIEYDHADIYPHLESLKQAFVSLINLIPPRGLLVYCADNLLARELASKAPCTCLSYGKTSKAKVRLYKRIPSPKGQEIIFSYTDRLFNIFVPLIGEHNALNTLAVWTILVGLGFEPEKIAPTFGDFRGTKRRQEVLCYNPIVIIDDFAHHPTAVRVTLRAVAEAFSPKRIVACFEPRTNTSRRNIFQKDYKKALAEGNVVLLKEPPDIDKVPQNQRICLKTLTQGLRNQGIEAYHFSGNQELLKKLIEIIRPGDLVIFMSNGPFDHLPVKLHQSLSQAKHLCHPF